MILALTGVASAMDCAEVRHMQDAGLPASEIVASVSAASWVVDPAFRHCLRVRGVDRAVVDAVDRMPSTRASWIEDVNGAWNPGPTPRISVDLECGVVDVQGVDGPTTTLTGGIEARGSLRVALAEGRLELKIVDGDGLGPGDPAALPRIAPPTSRRPIEAPCGSLRLEVPRGAALEIRSTRADVYVRSVEGALAITSHFGDIDLVGDTPELVLKTTGGTIRADTGARFADVQTVSGVVELGLGDEARGQVTSISGSVWVWGGPLRRLSVDTVSGDVFLNATVADQGNVSLVTHKGRIEAIVPDGQVALTSHEGQAYGPPRLIRPDGPSTRIGPAMPAPRFPSLDQLAAATRGLWSQDRPDRWWFPTGGVVSRVQPRPGTSFELQARSFSGDVKVRTAERWPAPTGPVIARLDGVSDRLDACSRDQIARRPGIAGHAVAHLRIRADGTLESVSAPVTATDATAVEDGLFSACVVRAVKGLTFPPGGDAEVRWPVRFQVPVPPAIDRQSEGEPRSAP